MNRITIAALASAILITSCGNKANNHNSADEARIINERMKEDHQYQYCQTDVDGDGRDEILAMGSMARYTAYVKKNDIITSADDIEFLIDTGDFSTLEFGNGHVKAKNAGFMAESTTSWIEERSIILENSKRVMMYWRSYVRDSEYDKITKYLTNDDDTVPCTREEAMKHLEVELTDINNIPKENWIQVE